MPMVARRFSGSRTPSAVARARSVSPRPSVVIAPPGVGLTTAVRLVVNELGFEALWLSQGHTAVKTLIERAASPALKGWCEAKQKLPKL